MLLWLCCQYDVWTYLFWSLKEIFWKHPHSFNIEFARKCVSTKRPISSVSETVMTSLRGMNLHDVCVPDSAARGVLKLREHKTATRYGEQMRILWINSGRTARGGSPVRCMARVLQHLTGRNRHVEKCYTGRRIPKEQKSILWKLLGSVEVLNYQMMPNDNTKNTCNYRSQWFTNPALKALDAIAVELWIWSSLSFSLVSDLYKEDVSNWD